LFIGRYHQQNKTSENVNSNYGFSGLIITVEDGPLFIYIINRSSTGQHPFSMIVLTESTSSWEDFPIW
jgi:hypothetical protein